MRTSHRLLSALAGLALTAGVLTATTAEAGAHIAAPAKSSEASHWSKERTGPRPTTPPRSISCPTRDSCTAVAGWDVALHYDGHSWGNVQSASDDLGPMTSVSCPTTSFCAGIGPHFAAVEKHGRWGRPTPSSFGLSAISCPNAHWCLAVGDDGHTLRYDGRSWHSAPRAPQSLVAVSCASRTFCMAEGLNGKALRFGGKGWHRSGDILFAASGAPGGLSCGSRSLCLAGGGGRTAARWNGHRWVEHHFDWAEYEHGAVSCGAHFCQVLTPAHAARWHGSWKATTDVTSSGETEGSQLSVSCATARRCVGLTLEGETLVLRAGTWRSEPYPGSSNVVSHLSCPTADFCMGIDEAGSGRVRRGGTWSPVAMAEGFHAYPVDCTSPTFCLAPTTQGTATWDGTSWTMADSSGAYASDDFDCVTPTYCLAVGADGQTQVWDGASWTNAPSTDVYPATLSCGATNDCWAGGGSSEVAHFDGTSWSTPERIAPTGVDDFNVIDVSCPTSTSCGAHDEHGNLYRYSGGAWGHHAQAGQGRANEITAFSCGSATSCTAVLGQGEDLGKVTRFDGTSWTTSRALPRGYSGRLTNLLSCGTSRACVLIDYNGTAWVRH